MRIHGKIGQAYALKTVQLLPTRGHVCAAG
jgi:hypothetical protein